MESFKKLGFYTKLTALAGVGTAVILAIKFLTKGNDSISKPDKEIDLNTVLQMLKFYRRNLYSSFQTMKMVFSQIKDATQGRASDSEISEIVKIHPIVA